jgi:transcriptional regulator with XRE-family HTH domain
VHLHKKGDTEMGTLYERINSLCSEKGITGGKLCTDLKMSKGTLTDLKMGRQTGISATKAQKIASYFNVSVGYLLGEEEKKEQSAECELSIKKKEFIQKVQKMTDSQIERLEQILALVEKTDL